MNILVIIPARSGSKGISNKNIKNFIGKPLMVWSIEQAQKSKYNKNMRIVVSTDSKEYQSIALGANAECPFLRPVEISGDLSTDYECISHCVNYYNKELMYYPDMILHLRPTQPCRKIYDIDTCIEVFDKNSHKYDSLRTVVELEKTPYKMYEIENNCLKPLLTEYYEHIEPFNKSRQMFPKVYLHNGYIDILKPALLKEGKISGLNIYPYVMEKYDTIDIDVEEDWVKAEKQFVYESI